MTVQYQIFGSGEDPTEDIHGVLRCAFAHSPDKAKMQIINEYRCAVDDDRDIYALSEFDDLFRFNSDEEKAELMEKLDKKAPYFEYNGVDVESLDEVDETIYPTEIDDLVEWLATNDRWGGFPSLLAQIEVIEEDEEDEEDE